ncbi:hypothetical protein K227x_44270 [Rubripirellula lacrimiformis]|uniref:Uncharacterized protein n=1 Tax=Rubripirellula lacrimiformis TaxID=1930273 RepID=A0A517NFX1_9BACT|nr:hypothetical protein [Rubripirellula lacrimiformis]QDT06020.1 hypothetical protein K227x_44270 [Rubripirellula lacrimiformis]
MMNRPADHPNDTSAAVVKAAAVLLLGLLALGRWVALPVAIAPQGNEQLVRTQRFDASAYVGVDAGADGLPGIAEVDDGANGIVDDRVELGATGSDDRLRVITSDQYLLDPDVLPLVLQRGAWVDVDSTSTTDPKSTRQFFRRAADADDGTTEVWESMKHPRIQPPAPVLAD